MIRRSLERVTIRRITHLAIVLACACSANGNNAKQEHSDVSDELRQVSAHPDLEIVIRTGTEHWRAGEITLLVRGNGSASVTQRQASGTASFAASLDKDEVDAFGRELAQRRFTARRTSKMPREPDDTPVRLALQRGGKIAFELEVWDGDRDGDADLDAILVAGQRLVHRVTKGALGTP
jgi:hypothetical protein